MYRRMKDTFNIRSIFGHVRKIVESDCYLRDVYLMAVRPSVLTERVLSLRTGFG
jgi:hypothetical protein